MSLLSVFKPTTARIIISIILVPVTIMAGLFLLGGYSAQPTPLSYVFFTLYFIANAGFFLGTAVLSIPLGGIVIQWVYLYIVVSLVAHYKK